MQAEDKPQLARRVVTGVGADGRSRIDSDAEAGPWVRRPHGPLIMDLWRVEILPTPVSSVDAATENVILAPPRHGAVVRTTVFPPDRTITPEARAAYDAQIAEIYGPQDTISTPTSGMHTTMHATCTVDVMTVIDGEIWAVMEDGECRLGPGDTIVQRGTRHAWQNRGEIPATVVTTMLAATRE